MDKLKIENLDLYYEKFHALKDINLSIPRNRIAAFIGPSGCGKSTLLKTLNRMNDLVPGCRVTGKVLLDGTDVLTPDTDVNLLRKRVGMVFQKPNPFPMSVYDNIAYGPRTHGIHGRARLDELVEQSLQAGGHLGRAQGPAAKKRHGAFPAASSKGCASRAPWPCSRRCCSWTRRPPRLTPSPPAKSKSWRWSSRSSIPS